MQKKLLNIFLSLVLNCTLIFDVSAALDHAEEFYLDNGLQVLVIPNHKAPVIQQVMLYKTGRIDEPEGKGGIAHFLEHLMFRGTYKFSDGEFEKLIEENGGVSNAATSLDFTYYHQFLSIDRLELAMYLEADRMTGLKIDDAAFSKEKEVVFQERQQRINMSPVSKFWEKYNRYLWNGAVYGEPISGTSQQIKNITKQDVLSFYQRYYKPNNAVLILSGDIDVETAKELAQKYYGKISFNQMDAKDNISEIDIDEFAHNESDIASHYEDVKVSRVVGSYILPHYQGDSSTLYSLILLSEYLSESVTSPLYQKMVAKEHLAVSAQTAFDYLNRGNSVFEFYAYFQDERNLPKIKKIFQKTLRETLDKLTEKELNKVKSRLLAGMVYQYDNPATAANIAVQWLGAGYSLADLKQFENNINKVTLQQVLESTAMLSRLHPVWGTVLPFSGENK